MSFWTSPWNPLAIFFVRGRADIMKSILRDTRRKADIQSIRATRLMHQWEDAKTAASLLERRVKEIAKEVEDFDRIPTLRVIEGDPQRDD